MKLFKAIISVALAATVLVSCTDDRKTATYDAQAQANKIETAICQSALLLNPNFYYESTEAIAWLLNYCTHEHVADITDASKRMGEIMDAWTTTSEADGVKTIRTIYQLSELTGHFAFEPNEASGKAVWTVEEAKDFQISWPCEDGLTAVLTLKVSDSSTKFLEDKYEESGYDEAIYMVFPKRIAISLVKGGRTLAKGTLNASYKIANEDKIIPTDNLNFSLNLNVEGYKVVMSNCKVNTKDAKISLKIASPDNQILKVIGDVKGIKFNEETQSVDSAEKLSFKADLMGQVQVVGDVNIAAVLDCQAAFDEASSYEDDKRIYEALNKALNIVFYYDGFKTPQAHVLFDIYDPAPDESELSIMTYDNVPIEFDFNRLEYCYYALLAAFEYIGFYECPECAH